MKQAEHEKTLINCANRAFTHNSATIIRFLCFIVICCFVLCSAAMLLSFFLTRIYMRVCACLCVFVIYIDHDRVSLPTTDDRRWLR